MKLSIQPTNLSSETLNHIDRMAGILAGGKFTQEQITTVMVQLASLGFYDGKLAGYDSLLEPKHFPSDLKWSESDGRIGEELN